MYLQEHGVEVAIQAIYRDLEYAKTLIKARTASSKGAIATGLDEDEFTNIEENWTFIGDDSDPELKMRIQDLNLSREPRVNVAIRGMSVVQPTEPIERKGSKSKG
jgi:sterol 3beta-glucosyltransferase